MPVSKLLMQLHLEYCVNYSFNSYSGTTGKPKEKIKETKSLKDVM